MNRRSKALRPLRVAAHFTREQLWHHLRGRALRPLSPLLAALERSPRTPDPWGALFAGISPPETPGVELDGLRQRRFEFDGTTVVVGPDDDWSQVEATMLTRFQLHYFDWLWDLARLEASDAQTVFEDLWWSWRRGTSRGRGVAWEPYVTACRAWNLCVVVPRIAADSDCFRDVAGLMHYHLSQLVRLLERDVGGNHLIKDLKGLLALALVLGDSGAAERWATELTSTAASQLLADGGHVERAPYYHLQVLGDLLDAATVMRASGLSDLAAELNATCERMRLWAEALADSTGSVPNFGDSPRRAPRVLLDREANPIESRLLEASGFAVLASPDNFEVSVNLGSIAGTRVLPGHSHADSLSFQMLVSGELVVCDAGCSTYAPGPVRSYERSTVAHSTIAIDGEDQSEIFGAFRVGHLARTELIAFLPSASGGSLTAAHDGFRHLPGAPRHERTLSLSNGCLEVIDNITGAGQHRIAQSVPLAPGFEPVATSAGMFDIGSGLAIVFLATPGEDLEQTVRIERAWASTGHGSRETSARLERRLDLYLPARLAFQLCRI